MRSTNKSSTLKGVLDANGGKHDAIASLSIVTQLTSYLVRFNLLYPIAVTTDTHVTVKRSSLSLSKAIPIVNDTEALQLDLTKFIEGAQALAVTLPYTADLSTADCFAECVADFTKMIADIVQPTSVKAEDPEAAFVTQIVPGTLRAAGN